ncbi:amidase [Rhexocercosporidium sp. MPI-PUGE-AT-0058]|nr:amidase [Rhexocercosporidium sp. MPI-PUGE-AT-0058]
MSSTTGPADDEWRKVAAKYQVRNAAKIPEEWRLPESILSTISENNPLNVLHVPRTCGILSDAEVAITEDFSAVELVRKMADAQLSSLEVTQAFCKRAAIAQQLVNCLTETFFDLAFERAKFLDLYLLEHGKPMGSLHGLPISLKDGFNIKGIPSTLGYLSFLKHPLPDKNCPLVDTLLSLGAVLYVKTNIPQTLMTADSHNNLFGRTLNPLNLTLTSGGSSGGEGALVALRGSLIGVGTDIAGSVRIPALCCGTYSLKGSVGRIPFGSVTSATRAGSPGVLASAGPLTTSAEDLRLFLSAVLGPGKPWEIDSTSLCAPWREFPQQSRPLHIGFILQDEAQPVSPPIVRALKTAVRLLEDTGHKVSTLQQFPSLQAAYQLCWRFFDIDPQKTSMRHIIDGKEPFVPSVQHAIAAKVRQQSAGPESGPLEMDELFEMTHQRSVLRQEWNDIFVKNGFDAILLPSNTTPAPPHDMYETAIYTALANLLDYPASIIPFLKADKTVDVADAKFPSYDPDVEHGAPCSIQLMTRTLREEELVDVTEIVDKVLQSRSTIGHTKL